MVNILGIAMKLMGRYGGLTGNTWLRSVGNKFLLVGIFKFFFFLASKREIVDQLLCMHMSIELLIS
jgi:hypothetical protein